MIAQRALILIPAYNEGKAIRSVVKTALEFCSHVLVVDDGSGDDTSHESKQAGAILISHVQNRGKGQAIQTGFNYFLEQKNLEVLVILDADGQHDPRELPLFFNAYEKTKSDIILGNRMQNTKDMPIERKIVNHLTSWIVSGLARVRIHDCQCGYRLMSRKVVSQLELKTSNFDLESEMLIQAGRKGAQVSEVMIQTIYGDEQSHIRPIVDTIRFIRLIARNLF